ncbi:MAG: hypothetical protein ACW976_04675, partial [Candidatus Ranarchaeia archaeon]
MSRKPIPPTELLRFMSHHKRLFLRLLRANPLLVRRQVRNVRRMKKPLAPTFEGTGGPMEEGMVYVMFNGEESPESIQNLNSVWRVFWVVAPELNYHQIDSFLISEVFKNHHWERYYRDPIFHNLSKDRWHQEIHLKEMDMVMDGTWNTGYNLKFDDRLNQVSGDLQF